VRGGYASAEERIHRIEFALEERHEYLYSTKEYRTQQRGAMAKKTDTIIRILAGITVAILLVLAFFFVQTNKQPVHFISDPWPPYIIGEVEAEPSDGPAVHLLVEIFNQLNVPMDMKLFEWNQVLKDIKSGNADAIMGISKSAERLEYLSFTRHFMEITPYIYYRIGRFDGPFEWNTMSDFKGLRIGLLQGVDYGGVFNVAIKEYDLDVSYGKTSSENNTRLVNGDIDLFIAIREIEDVQLRNDPSLRGMIAMSKKPLTEGKKYHIAFSKKSHYADLVPEIDAILDEMENDGSLKRIMTSYTEYSVENSVK